MRERRTLSAFLPSRKSVLRVSIALVYMVIAPVVLFGLAELALRVFWTNPYYLKNEYPEYTRFHPLGFSAHGRADDLYPNGGRIRLAINGSYAIENGRTEAPQCFALGGSTTESGLVPEGSRWPDLLRPATANYGVSKNTSIETYYNLRFLLERGRPTQPCVLVMHAVNDLRAYLLEGPDAFALDKWRLPPMNMLAVEGDVLLPFGARVKDYDMTSFVIFHMGEWRGRFFFPHYLAQRRDQDVLGLLDEHEFSASRRRLRSEFLPRRGEVLRAIQALVSSRGGRLYFLTQPHAFSDAYRPFRGDLRLYPVVAGKRTNTAQASGYMDDLNEHTRRMARELGVTLIDVETCLRGMDPSPLFYDSVHYSMEGGRAVAACVQQGLVPLRSS